MERTEKSSRTISYPLLYADKPLNEERNAESSMLVTFHLFYIYLFQ